MHWDPAVDALFQKTADLEGALPEKMEGCTDDDILHLQEHAGHRLPGAFVALLKRCGRSWGDLMQGEDVSFPGMLRYRGIAESLLEDLAADMAVEVTEDVDLDALGVQLAGGARDLRLEDRDFVFFFHQGYQFLFFRLGESDNPPVYHYNHDEPAFNKVSDTFMDWLASCIDEEVALRGG